MINCHSKLALLITWWVKLRTLSRRVSRRRTSSRTTRRSSRHTRTSIILYLKSSRDSTSNRSLRVFLFSINRLTIVNCIFKAFKTSITSFSGSYCRRTSRTSPWWTWISSSKTRTPEDKLTIIRHWLRFLSRRLFKLWCRVSWTSRKRIPTRLNIDLIKVKIIIILITKTHRVNSSLCNR